MHRSVITSLAVELQSSKELSIYMHMRSSPAVSYMYIYVYMLLQQHFAVEAEYKPRVKEYPY